MASKKLENVKEVEEEEDFDKKLLRVDDVAYNKLGKKQITDSKPIKKDKPNLYKKLFKNKKGVQSAFFKNLIKKTEIEERKTEELDQRKQKSNISSILNLKMSESNKATIDKVVENSEMPQQTQDGKRLKIKDQKFFKNMFKIKKSGAPGKILNNLVGDNVLKGLLNIKNESEENKTATDEIQAFNPYEEKSKKLKSTQFYQKLFKNKKKGKESRFYKDIAKFAELTYKNSINSDGDNALEDVNVNKSPEKSDINAESKKDKIKFYNKLFKNKNNLQNSKFVKNFINYDETNAILSLLDSEDPLKDMDEDFKIQEEEIKLILCNKALYVHQKRIDNIKKYIDNHERTPNNYIKLYSLYKIYDLKVKRIEHIKNNVIDSVKIKRKFENKEQLIYKEINRILNEKKENIDKTLDTNRKETKEETKNNNLELEKNLNSLNLLQLKSEDINSPIKFKNNKKTKPAKPSEETKKKRKNKVDLNNYWKSVLYNSCFFRFNSEDEKALNYLRCVSCYNSTLKYTPLYMKTPISIESKFAQDKKKSTVKKQIKGELLKKNLGTIMSIKSINSNESENNNFPIINQKYENFSQHNNNINSNKKYDDEFSKDFRERSKKGVFGTILNFGSKFNDKKKISFNMGVINNRQRQKTFKHKSSILLDDINKNSTNLHINKDANKALEEMSISNINNDDTMLNRRTDGLSIFNFNTSEGIKEEEKESMNITNDKNMFMFQSNSNDITTNTNNLTSNLNNLTTNLNNITNRMTNNLTNEKNDFHLSNKSIFNNNQSSEDKHKSNNDIFKFGDNKSVSDFDQEDSNKFYEDKNIINMKPSSIALNNFMEEAKNAELSNIYHSKNFSKDKYESKQSGIFRFNEENNENKSNSSNDTMKQGQNYNIYKEYITGDLSIHSKDKSINSYSKNQFSKLFSKDDIKSVNSSFNLNNNGSQSNIININEEINKFESGKDYVKKNTDFEGQIEPEDQGFFGNIFKLQKEEELKELLKEEEEDTDLEAKTIVFEFDENPYFTNTTLEKTYFYDLSKKQYLPYPRFTPIDWKEEGCEKIQVNKELYIEIDSFFNFFSLKAEICEANFILTNLIPNSLYFFLDINKKTKLKGSKFSSFRPEYNLLLKNQINFGYT